MRIESEFHDYYDSLQRLTPGDPDVWHRKREDILLTKRFSQENPFSGVHLPRRSKNTYDKIFTIYFCGKVYIGLDYSTDGPYYVGSVIRYGTQYCHVFGKDKIFEAMGEKDFYSTFNPKAKNSWFYPSWDQFVQRFTQKYIDDIHLKYNSPIIYENESQITVNPQLKVFNFQSVVDPYNAFQEIDMFRNSFLKTLERPMVQISEKDKIHKHGFDNWSFRKQSEKLKK